MTAIIHTWSCILLYVLIGWKLADVGKLVEYCFKDIDGIESLPETAVTLILCIVHVIWIAIWPLAIAHGAIVVINKRCKERRNKHDN